MLLPSLGREITVAPKLRVESSYHRSGLCSLASHVMRFGSNGYWDDNAAEKSRYALPKPSRVQLEFKARIIGRVDDDMRHVAVPEVRMDFPSPMGFRGIEERDTALLATYCEPAFWQFHKFRGRTVFFARS